MSTVHTPTCAIRPPPSPHPARPPRGVLRPGHLDPGRAPRGIRRAVALLPPPPGRLGSLRAHHHPGLQRLLPELLLALLTIGALSDHLGRRPVLMSALLLQAASMVLGVKRTASRKYTVPVQAGAKLTRGGGQGPAAMPARVMLLVRADRPGRSGSSRSRRAAPAALDAAPVAAPRPPSWAIPGRGRRAACPPTRAAR